MTADAKKQAEAELKQAISEWNAATEAASAAREEADRLSAVARERGAAVHAARVSLDMLLPQCVIVAARRVGSYNDRPGAIVRRTPKGWLVVRYHGDDKAKEMMFAPDRSGRYWLRASALRLGLGPASNLYLSDLPAEYTHQGAQHD